MANTQVRIDPNRIPDDVFDQACAVLHSSISAALADPELRREYEAWKIDYAARTATEVMK